MLIVDLDVRVVHATTGEIRYLTPDVNRDDQAHNAKHQTAVPPRVQTIRDVSTHHSVPAAGFDLRTAPEGRALPAVVIAHRVGR